MCGLKKERQYNHLHCLSFTLKIYQTTNLMKLKWSHLTMTIAKLSKIIV